MKYIKYFYKKKFSGCKLINLIVVHGFCVANCFREEEYIAIIETGSHKYSSTVYFPVDNRQCSFSKRNNFLCIDCTTKFRLSGHMEHFTKNVSEDDDLDFSSRSKDYNDLDIEAILERSRNSSFRRSRPLYEGK